MWIRRVGASVDALAYSPDSRTLYTIEGARVRAWDLASRQPTQLFRLEDIQGHNTSGAFVTADGRYFVANAHSNYAVWDLRTEKLVTSNLYGCGEAVRAPVGPTIRFRSTGSKTIKCYDPSKDRTHTLVGTAHGLVRFWYWAFTPDDTKVLLFGQTRTRNSVVLLDRSTGTPTPVPAPAWGLPDAICYSPDGTSLLWQEGNRIEIWDAATTSVRIPLFECLGSSRVFAIHPRSQTFVSPCVDGNVMLSSLLTGAPIRTFELGCGLVRCLAFSPDGLTCAVGGSNKQFAVFDLDL